MADMNPTIYATLLASNAIALVATLAWLRRALRDKDHEAARRAEIERQREYWKDQAMGQWGGER